MLKLPFLTLIAAISFTASISEPVRAAVLNGGFETGDYNDWTTTGQATVEDASFGVTPTEGTYQAVLETLQDETEVSGSDLEAFLGLSTGTLTNLGAVEGSAIKQTITVNTGDILTFSWNFLTDQDSPSSDFNDFAFFSLSEAVTPLADTFAPNVMSFSRLARETGYQSYSYTFPVAGTYTLGFGVVDVGDRTVNSALLIDNSQAIPEPLTILGTLMAIGFGSWFRRSMSQ